MICQTVGQHLKNETHDARVTTVTVGDELEEDGSLAAGDPVASVLNGLLDSNDIHSIGLDTRDLVTTGEVLGIRRAALCGCTHSVLIVLTNEDTREIPKFCLTIKLVGMKGIDNYSDAPC